MKSEIFNAVASLNRGFDVVLESLNILREQGVISVDYVQRQTEIIEEVRSGLNGIILDRLGGREREDRQHYAKMRTTTETRLRSTDSRKRSK